jgi:hypothetical protein
MTFITKYNVTPAFTMEWERAWQDNHVLNHMAGEHTLDNDGTVFSRLQYNHHPYIFNDYRQWPQPVQKISMEFVERLHRLSQLLPLAYVR